MFNLLHERVASEQIADRVRRTDRERRAQEARRQIEDAHRREVDRVRASVLLVPRSGAGADASREG